MYKVRYHETFKFDQLKLTLNVADNFNYYEARSFIFPARYSCNWSRRDAFGELALFNAPALRVLLSRGQSAVF